jgi:intermediate cleaving peptidase 55
MFARARIWSSLLRKQQCLGTQKAVSRRGISVSAAELRFGQPVHETHPHLLKAGEGANPSFFLLDALEF